MIFFDICGTKNNLMGRSLTNKIMNFPSIIFALSGTLLTIAGFQ